MIKLNRKKLDALAAEYKLNYVVLFGSRARKEAKSDSDFDIAYSSRRDINYGEETFLIDKLASTLKLKPNQIDLINVKNAGPLLLNEIADNPILLGEYSKDCFDKFQIYALMRYFEAGPLFKMQAEYVNRNIK